MEKFTISLAGICISVHALYESTRTFCKEYLCDSEDAEFVVSISSEDIAFEREKSKKEEVLEGIPVREFPDNYLETLAVYRKICTLFLERNILLFHGSVVAVDGEAYLFTAKSGIGKSTHTALWRQIFGERAVMINDDKPLLKVTSEGVWACGTPWNGKHGLGCNKMVPLKAICILERASDNRICRISGKEALNMLVQQSFRTGEPVGMLQLLELLNQITEKTALYRLGCNMDPQAALIAYEGMQK